METTRSRARALKTIAATLAGAVALAALGVGVVYLYRREIGLRLASDYLRSRGVPAILHIDRLDAGGFSGGLVLGDPADPDLTVDRLDVEFAPLQIGIGGLTIPRVRAVRFFRPVLKARLNQQGLRFGSLQRLIDESARGPGGGPPPAVTIVAGRLRLETPGGVLEVDGDGELQGGRLVRLAARAPPARLAWNGLSARDLQARLDLAAPGDRLHAKWWVRAADVQARDARVRGLDMSGQGAGPYPSGAGNVRGGLDADVTLSARDMGLGRVVVRDLVSRLHASGELARMAGRLAFSGDARASATAATAEWGRVSLARLSVALRAARSRLDYAHSPHAARPLTIRTELDGRLSAARLGGPGLPWGAALRDAAAAAHGRLAFGPSGLGLDLGGSGGVSADLAQVQARRLAKLLPPVLGQDLREALAANLRGVRLRAADYRISLAGPRMELRLGAPVRADFAAGAAVQIQPRPSGPVLSAVGASRSGAFDAALAGEGLPSVTLQVARWSSEASGAAPRADALSTISVDGDAGALRGVRLRARARLVRLGAGLRIVAQECADLAFASLGPPATPDLSAFQARLCPAPAPLLDLGLVGWTSAGSVTALQALAPGAKLALTRGEATFDLRSGAPLGGGVRLARLRIEDAARPRRLQPLTVSGAGAPGPGGWTGALSLGLDSSPSPVGRLTFAYEPRINSGEVELDSTDLRFRPGGLQPASFAPAAAQWMSSAAGALEVDARLSWSGATVTSRGEVRSAGLDMQTPAGRVRGLAGRVSFASLYPPTTASTQTLRARSLDAAAPLTDLSAAFDIDPRRLTLRRVEATLAAGRITLDPLSIPLTAGPELAGVVRLSHVDVGTLLSSLGLADSVALQARMSGALPFSLGPGPLTVSNGRLAADGPGRLTIRREALGGAVTTAGAAGAQPNAVQDFAYQALENLAFDALDAQVASLPKGRLGVLLHVQGRHDPAVAVPTRVRLLDLLAGHAFDKPLPLPKGTGVELTLDTSLNLDELLADYGALRTTAGSAGVQPATAK